MPGTRHHHHKKRYSKWLLAATLVLGLVSFSGLVTRAQPAHNIKQTTWVVNLKGRSATNISYNRVFNRNHVAHAI
ncbi:MAG TPA: hypothetical protein VHC47_12115, partial [Mucilaginibacter sp.]|nr:hypothetical protein [Mucilaginibacter sp.]